MSSLRETVADAKEQAHRDSILDALTEIGSNYAIKIIAPDTLRSNYTLNSDSVRVLDQLKGGSTVSVSTSFDF